MVHKIKTKKANYILQYLDPDFDKEGYKRIRLYVVSSLEPNYQRSIIIKESATGDNGYVIDNGRLQTSITVNGELLSSTNEELMKYEKKLIDLQGRIVELISNKFNSLGASNKFLIQSFTPTQNNISDVSMPFTMVLQEYREVNVNTTSEELTNLQDSQALIQLQKSINGLLPINDEEKLINIRYRNNTYTTTVNKFLRQFNVKILERYQDIYDTQGNLLGTKTKGYSLSTGNHLVDTVLEGAFSAFSFVGVTPNVSVIGPLLSEFINIEPLPDAEIIVLNNGEKALVGVV